MPSPARNAALPLAALGLGLLLGAHDSIHLERLLRALASAYTLHGAAVALWVAAWRMWVGADARLAREYDQGRADGFRAGLECRDNTNLDTL